jgi:hypothetical protein
MTTRTQIAEQELARAKREDAQDAAMAPCRVCGTKPGRAVWGGDGSVFRGHARVWCPKGCQETKVDPTQRQHEDLDWAERESIWRWQALNRTPDVDSGRYGIGHLEGEVRQEIAAILETIARDGLPGPRDLDVALDAIGCILAAG